MKYDATSVQDYLAKVPADRRAAIQTVRETILKNLDKEYEEGMQYGMIGYYVPHRIFPAGYHCDPKQPLPFASLASQKNHMALYLMGIYMNPDLERWFVEAWTRTGRKLDKGKSCIRFSKVEDLALDVLGETFRRLPARTYIEIYQRILATRTKGESKPAPKKGKPGKRATSKAR